MLKMAFNEVIKIEVQDITPTSAHSFSSRKILIIGAGCNLEITMHGKTKNLKFKRVRVD